MHPKFGPSGNSDIFYKEGHKSSLEAPEWLNGMGLQAFEYSCSRGINIREDTAIKLGTNAGQYGIELSIHGPYYINMASQDSQKILNSINYIIDSVKAAKWMGAKLVVFHPGSCAKIDRSVAFKTVLHSLKKTIDILDEMRYTDVIISPETMGKQNQLGTLDEIMELCKIDERLIPTVDFGHINALGVGSLKCSDDYRKILDSIKNSLGEFRLKNMHCHFSRIEFTKAGEKKHWTLADKQYGPDFEPLAELLVEYDINATIICESRGTMAEDALELKSIYESFLKSN